WCHRRRRTRDARVICSRPMLWWKLAPGVASVLVCFTTSLARAQGSQRVSAPPTYDASGAPAGAPTLWPAQRTPSRQTVLLEEYRARELYTRYTFWSGQKLYRAGVPVDLGYFGGGGDEIFAGSARALDSISTYRTLRITGTTAWVVGLGLLATDL